MEMKHFFNATTLSHQFTLDIETNSRSIDKYAGDQCGSDLVSVLNATIPENHPPVSTVVGGRDYLRDEGILYSLRLRNAGVDSQLEIIPGVPHGINFPPTTHAARQFFLNQVRILNGAYQQAAQ